MKFVLSDSRNKQVSLTSSAILVWLLFQCPNNEVPLSLLVCPVLSSHKKRNNWVSPNLWEYLVWLLPKYYHIQVLLSLWVLVEVLLSEWTYNRVTQDLGECPVWSLSDYHNNKSFLLREDHPGLQFCHRLSRKTLIGEKETLPKLSL